MKYRKFIEDYFLIDDPEIGELVPFKFNKVQAEYYEDVLVKLYDIENKGISVPLREHIVKFRRGGFSSLILGLFCADDIASLNPTETNVLSYKDDATEKFRKRYRIFALSFFAKREMGITIEQIKKKPDILEEVAKKYFSVDTSSIEMKHNKAMFSCGTASARVGGRGGVLQKLLMSEAAYYPDTEKMTAKEIIEGTMRQVDLRSGWVFIESTENGSGTYQHKLWKNAKKGLSRFMNRFFGWRSFYTEEEYATIKSEFVDPDMLRREYPEVEDDLFKSSENSFTGELELLALVEHEKATKEICYTLELQGVNYIDQCEIIASAIEQIIKMNPTSALYAGLDTAKQKDKTTLVILKDRRKVLNPGLKIMAIDATGNGGQFVPDWFERNTSYYIEKVVFSRQSKDMMYKNLTVVIKDQQTSLPVVIENGNYVSEEWEHFMEEMLSLTKKTIGNLIVVAHPEGEDNHDDYPDSWALAEHGYVVLNGANKRTKPEKVEDIPDALSRMLDRKKSGNKLVDSEYD